MSSAKVVLAAVSVAVMLSAAGCQTIAPPAGSVRGPVVAAGPAGAEGAAAPRAVQAADQAQAILPPAPIVAAAAGITVVGEGVLRVEPDVAYLTTGVQTRSQTAKQAQDENSRLMAAVVQRLRSLGIEAKDIRTTGVNLHPVYENQPGTITGYEASNTVSVTVQDVAKTGEVLDAAVSAGANLSSNVRFGLKDDSAVRRQALDQAVKAARAKAEAIAGAAGLRVAAVQSMIDESSGQPDMPEMARMGMAQAADMGPVPVQPGQLAVNARVRVVYTFQ